MKTLDMPGVDARDEVAAGQSARRPSVAGVRLAYLLSQYPAVSHTFFLNEIVGLRARGLHIETSSVNTPDRRLKDLPALEAAEAARTFYLKQNGAMHLSRQILTTTFSNPLALWRGLRAVARIPSLTARRRAFWLFYLAEAMLLGRWMRDHDLRHLHVHFGGPVASVGMLAAAAWNVPFSVTIHGPEELLNSDANQLREKLAAATFIICISDFCRSQLMQLIPPSEWHKLEVVRLGVDPLALQPVLRDRSTATLRVVSVGRLVPAKGHRILLEAVTILSERGHAVHLTLVGGGPELVDLQRFVETHHIADQVIFMSALSHAETLAIVRNADVFALSSFAEGIPVALMEAMSFGVPCVSTLIAGIPELITSGVEGFLVPASNSQAFADALESLATDPALRRRLGAAARERIIDQYNLPLNQELLAHRFAQRLLPGACA